MSYAERGAYAPEHPDERYAEDDDDAEEGGRGPLLLGVAAAVVVAFSAVIWSAYHQGVREGGRDAPPLILADEQPFRERPENPGGASTPHMDIEVFERLETGDADATSPIDVRAAIDLSAPPDTDSVADPVELASADVDPVADPAPVPAPSQEGEVEIADADADADTADAPPVDDPAPSAADVDVEAEAVLDAEPEPTEFAGAFEPDAPQIRLRPTPPDERETRPAAPADNAATPARDPAGGSDEAVYLVQLASHRSREAAENDWFEIQSESADLLGERQPLIIEVDLGDRGGVWFRIRLDGFSDRSEANDFCDLLRARSQNCLTVRD